MSAGPTLNSRIRVLVAKAFRAEKLYSSVNNTHGDRLTNLTVLSEAASEIRAKEWQRSHYQLRTALNEILAVGNGSEMASEVATLRNRFISRARESSAAVEAGAEELVETAKRHEFAHIFKISLELIRCKAQAQASKVIADELTALLDLCGRGQEAVEGASSQRRSDLENRDTPSSIRPEREEAREHELRSNVIPLTRRFALGSKKG